jgi:hypothetical protein
MAEPDELSDEALQAIRARLEEPPPLTRLQQDRMALVDEVDRLRAELAEEGPAGGAPEKSPGGE